MNEPLVSVILPAYNCEQTITAAINSILCQQYSYFELLIINDGSTDNTENLILSFGDKRIRYIKNEKNLGLIKTLNKGINLCKGDFVARMDADDISLGVRLSCQVQFFLKNPEYVMVGSSVQKFGLRQGIISYPSCHEELKGRLLFQNEFAHPSVMIRKSVLIDNNFQYEERYSHVEDYGLWCELSKVGRMSNIKAVLLKYRTSTQSISVMANKNIEERDDLHKLIYQNNFRAFGINASEAELNIHRALAVGSPYYFDRMEQLVRAETWLLFLKKTIGEKSYVSPWVLKKILAHQWFITCNKASSLGLGLLIKYYLKNPFSFAGIGLKRHLSFICKCLIKYKSKFGKGFAN